VSSIGTGILFAFLITHFNKVPESENYANVPLWTVEKQIFRAGDLVKFPGLTGLEIYLCLISITQPGTGPYGGYIEGSSGSEPKYWRFITTLD